MGGLCGLSGMGDLGGLSGLICLSLMGGPKKFLKILNISR